MPDRPSTLARLAGLIAAAGATRVAIDGPDAAGKTTLADELAPLLRAHGPVARVGIDDFLRPREERYRLGRESPVGYYLDSHDLAAFRGHVEAQEGLVLADGIFLLRPELDDLWHVRVFVDADPDELLRRGLRRDGEELRGRYLARYLPAQRRYAEELRPRERADAVLENTDPTAPVLRLR